MACPRLCRTEVMNYFAFLTKQLNKNLFDWVRSLLHSATATWRNGGGAPRDDTREAAPSVTEEKRSRWQSEIEDPTEEMRDKGAACRELMSKTAEAWKNEIEMLCFCIMDNRI